MDAFALRWPDSSRRLKVSILSHHRKGLCSHCDLESFVVWHRKALENFETSFD
jgi:hypothetical protein